MYTCSSKAYYLEHILFVFSQLMNHQADQNCSSSCSEQGITYVRLNPQLNEEVDSAETDNDRLLGMLWSTRQYLHSTRHENNKRKMKVLSESLLRMHL